MQREVTSVTRHYIDVNRGAQTSGRALRAKAFSCGQRESTQEFDRGKPLAAGALQLGHQYRPIAAGDEYPIRPSPKYFARSPAPLG